MEVQIQNGNNQLNVHVKYQTVNHCSNLTKSQPDKPRAYSFLIKCKSVKGYLISDHCKHNLLIDL